MRTALGVYWRVFDGEVKVMMQGGVCLKRPPGELDQIQSGEAQARKTAGQQVPVPNPSNEDQRLTGFRVPKYLSRSVSAEGIGREGGPQKKKRRGGALEICGVHLKARYGY